MNNEQVPHGYNDASTSGGRTDGRTDLLTFGFTMIYGENYAFLPLFTKALPTDGRTDLTNGRTQPLLEMRGRI